MNVTKDTECKKKNIKEKNITKQTTQINEVTLLYAVFQILQHEKLVFFFLQCVSETKIPIFSPWSSQVLPAEYIYSDLSKRELEIKKRE